MQNTNFTIYEQDIYLSLSDYASKKIIDKIINKILLKIELKKVLIVIRKTTKKASRCVFKIKFDIREKIKYTPFKFSNY